MSENHPKPRRNGTLIARVGGRHKLYAHKS